MTSSHHKDEGEPGKDSEVTYGRGLGIRHVQIAVMSVASFLAYLMRYNLSVAIVAMVRRPGDTDSTDSDVPRYDWDGTMQGYVLSSFFVGYLMSQIPAGLLSEKFGGHRVLCAGVLSSATLTIAFPQCAYIGGGILLCVNRILQGISQGLIFPSIFNLLGIWAPPAERSRLASVSLSAQLLGTVVSTPVSGFLCANFGWPSVFYVLGGASAGLGLLMIFLGADSPNTHRMISNAEKHYIQSSLGGAKDKPRVPWKQVLTSVPYYALTIGYALRGAVFTTFQTKTPTFIGTVLGFSIADNGLLSALPYLVSWMLSFVFSGLCDVSISRGWLRVSTARKLFNSIAYFGAAIFMVLLAHAESKTASVVYLVFAIGIQAGVYVGVQATFVDLAPNFSGAIFGATNFVSASLGVWGPNVVGFIVTREGSAEQWRIVFYLCASLLTFCNTVFLIWGTSETQWWNWPEKYKSKKDYEEQKKKMASEQ